MELIKIENVEGKETVNARHLWDFLEVKTSFIDWMKRRVNDYGFEKDNDYIVLLKNGKNQSGGRPSDDYFLSLDMAKELSMVERNEKGKQARQYFIECEKKANNHIDILSPAELIFQQAKQLVNQEKRLNEIESKINLIEAKQITIDENYYAVSGYCALHNLHFDSKQSAELGRKCSKLSREKDYIINKVYDSKYGHVNSYHTDVLKEVIC